MKHVLREPVLHFILISAAIFLIYELVGDDENNDSQATINISAAEIEQLKEQWLQQSGEEAGEEVMRALIDSDDGVRGVRFDDDSEVIADHVAERNTPIVQRAVDAGLVNRPPPKPNATFGFFLSVSTNDLDSPSAAGSRSSATALPWSPSRKAAIAAWLSAASAITGASSSAGNNPRATETRV